MSIRKYNKDHLKDHAAVGLVRAHMLSKPETEDPLVFWTHHEIEPCEVNLHPFATGKEEVHRQHGGGRSSKAFTGRPLLIQQLAPAIREAVLWVTKTTVDSYLASLREWWRILDAVEAAAAKAGQYIVRVENVTQLTHIHGDYAHSIKLNRGRFGKFRALVDVTRIALGESQTYWHSPEDNACQKHIPSEEQRKALRIAIKNVARSVLEKWALSDRLSELGVEPTDEAEIALYRNVQYMRKIQNETGKVLPTTNDFCQEISLTTRGCPEFCVNGASVNVSASSPQTGW